ncbi:MAG: PAS domain-containing protein [Kofleriaceae bacterium]|nr:PAS domain-containing protein [Kofleriaceae bacterium]
MGRTKIDRDERSPEPGADRRFERLRRSANQLGWFLAIVGAYFVAGKLALTIAIPPGYAVPVWPAAGIAVVAVLRYGYKAALAVGIASFLVNLHPGNPVGTFVAASIAVGASLHAASARFLIYRFVGYPCSLLRGRDVVWFLLLAGPVTSPIPATWGTATIFFVGLISHHAIAITWVTWWVGDSIGAVIFAPILLAFLGSPVDVWRRRRRTVVPSLLVGFIAVTLLFVRVRTWEEKRYEAEFARRSEVLTEAIQRQAERYVDAGTAVASLYHASEQVRLDELSTFVSSIFERDRGIRGVAWIKRVDAANRSAYEQRTRPSNFIWEISERETKQPAATRPTYYPIDQLVPSSVHQGALGFDLGSEPVRRAAMDRARDTGTIVATPPLGLVRSRQPGLLMLVPVYRSGAATATVAERRANLTGYAAVIIRASDIISTALGGYDRDGLHIRLVDATPMVTSSVLYDDQLETSSRGVSDARSFPVAGRIWRVETALTAKSVEAESAWQSWFVLAGGLSFVSLLGVVLLVLTGNESRLLAAESRYRDLNDRSPDMYATLDAETGVILDCNETAVAALNVDRHELIGRPWTDLYDRASRESADEALEEFRRVGEVHDVELQLARRGRRPLDVSLSVTALRDDAGQIVAGRSAWRDIGSRKLIERDLALRLALGDARRSLDDEVDYGTFVAGRVGTHLDVDRCYFSDIDLKHDTMVVLDDYHPRSSSIVGVTPLDVYGTAALALLRVGRTLVIDDTAADPRTAASYATGYEPHGLRAVLGVPLLREGRWVATLWAAHSEPRKWEPREIVLLQSVAERTWLWIEHARMVRRLRELNQSLEERIAARTRALELALHQQEILLREIHHRVKNNLQVISSLLSLQAGGSDDPALRTALCESRDRIQSLSLVHDQLYRASNAATIEIDQYLRQLVASIESTHHRPTVKIRVEATPCSLPLDQAVSVGLIVNELITNSLKHAFPGDRGGSVVISARVEGTVLRLSVRDDGVGLPAGFDVAKSTGLGMIILDTLSRQIGAKLVIKSDHGASFELLVPHAPPCEPKS